MAQGDRTLATELIIERERQARDEEASGYGSSRARDAYQRAVEEACLVRWLRTPAPETVLDAGCGTGQHLTVLLRLADRVIAVDHSPLCLELAAASVSGQDAERTTFHVGDLRSLPIADGAVDAAMSNGVLQHIPTAQARHEALVDLYRVLRPGGRIALMVYRWRGHIRRRKEGFFSNGIYRYAFTARELRAAFRDAGFQDVRVTGAVMAPVLSQRFGIGAETQSRLGERLLLRPLAHYLMAAATRPA